MGVKSFIKRAIGKMGFAVIRTGKRAPPYAVGYIPALQTVAAAKAQGLSVCDYVERLWNEVGDTQRIIEMMASYGVFEAPEPFILEIGPGTGRYIEKVLQRCKPRKYECYETAADWADYLRRTHPIVLQDADALSLRHTPANEVDILHAHGVFMNVRFLTTCSYFGEIFRCVKAGGSAVFDIMSEDCFDDATIAAWLAKGEHYPCFISTEFVTGLFGKHGFSLLGSFFTKYGCGRSKYLIFRRQGGGTA